ncbi:DEAD/DEAH box helicase/Helicase conserved C-terminal domain containing protein, putative [Leishmania donovani]|uniref:ATP-dependent RNA helicase n=1 Tax=Leishmania donovani TaxID=5661 RepID=A0A3S7WTP8_LEIDO|nr:DEAD/DEAH box helicase/Helicase conserved C-terminal domain containing protein, putative [Leishmania donovani]
MSLTALTAKRVRRTWEPEEKAWHDDALELPWEDIRPELHKASIFALKNVFFFSHATPVQALALRVLTQAGTSAVVEAPTGSGKTLSFLLPIMERCVRSCEAYVASHQRPPLFRHVLGVIFSPSRTLAEQTFVVGRSLAARYPFNIQFVLCDGVVQKPATVLQHLQRGARGAGTILVTTPKDFDELLPMLEEAQKTPLDPSSDDIADFLAQQDEATRQRYLARRAQANTDAEKGSISRDSVRFYSTSEARFVVVLDEADLLYNSTDMRNTVQQFVAGYGRTRDPVSPSPRRRKSAAKKRPVPEKEPGTAGARLWMDFAFVGATVATSPSLKVYARKVCAECDSTLHTLALRSNDDFVSQLSNRFVVCDAANFLPYFVQLMNLHASKKHFVFFNNFRVLLFVQRLFSVLCQGARPLLYIPKVFVMYEGMTESARIDQYNQFLTHVSRSNETRKPKKALSDAEKKNQVFTSGWKRDGTVSMGTGAILLCTDVAAFGLDVRDVDYVYHFEPPATVQSYIHRVGRVGRMGMKGSSILLLPCNANSTPMQSTYERKMDSTRFHTVTNTKKPTAQLQAPCISADSLPEERRAYVAELGKHSALEEYTIPPFAPITSTLRNHIKQDDKLLKLAKRAAISMCAAPDGEEEKAWFHPRLAVRALLLD